MGKHCVVKMRTSVLSTHGNVSQPYVWLDMLRLPCHVKQWFHLDDPYHNLWPPSSLWPRYNENVWLSVGDKSDVMGADDTWLQPKHGPVWSVMVSNDGQCPHKWDGESMAVAFSAFLAWCPSLTDSSDRQPRVTLGSDAEMMGMGRSGVPTRAAALATLQGGYNVRQVASKWRHCQVTLRDYGSVHSTDLRSELKTVKVLKQVICYCDLENSILNRCQLETKTAQLQKSLWSLLYRGTDSKQSFPDPSGEQRSVVDRWHQWLLAPFVRGVMPHSPCRLTAAWLRPLLAIWTRCQSTPLGATRPKERVNALRFTR